MSDFHPGTWNPSWSVATILTGLLSFMVLYYYYYSEIALRNIHLIDINFGQNFVFWKFRLVMRLLQEVSRQRMLTKEYMLHGRINLI